MKRKHDVKGNLIPKGWRIDRDRWLWRSIVKGDRGDGFWRGELNCHGFIGRTGDEANKVYARYAEHARAYDEACRSPGGDRI